LGRSTTASDGSGVRAAVAAYSSLSNGVNANSNLPNPTISTTLSCAPAVSAMGVSCSGPVGANALQVKQTVVIPTYFIRALAVFGVNSAKTISLTSVSSAASQGAAPGQYNVAIVIDTTGSMQTWDNDVYCGNTRIFCALEGVQDLLKGLSPCSQGSTAGNCKGAFDQASLFTYPNVTSNTATDDTTCTNNNNPTIRPYSTPAIGAAWVPTNFSTSSQNTTPTYQITNYLNDYSSTNQNGGALNSSSAITIATGGGTGTKNHPCNGMAAPGGENTYYAGAIYAAASSLQAMQAANPGSENALIILSDGDATADSNAGNIVPTGSLKLTNNGVYPSYLDQCAQGIAAAQYASSLTDAKGKLDTTVYTVAYGSPSSGCSSDAKSKSNPTGTNLTPCQTMAQMATSASTFYSDATATQSKGQCTSPNNTQQTNGKGGLEGIFQAILTQLTHARLIANNQFS
jgi:hypothetical protein